MNHPVPYLGEGSYLLSVKQAKRLLKCQAGLRGLMQIMKGKGKIPVYRYHTDANTHVAPYCRKFYSDMKQPDDEKIKKKLPCEHHLGLASQIKKKK